MQYVISLFSSFFWYKYEWARIYFTLQKAKNRTIWTINLTRNDSLV